MEKKLTVQDVRECVAKIAEIGEEPSGRAHALQDLLWRDVLRQLADEGNELAKAALETVALPFPRWYE